MTPQTAPDDSWERDPELEERLMSKVKRRLLPILVLASALAYLDRVSIAVIAEPMGRDLALSATAFGFAAGLFFVGYVVFEVPSNVALMRFGARRWIARIMLTWGLITVGTMFVESATALAIMRFALGVAEAGLFPGLMLYCTYWFPRTRITRVYAWFQTSIPIAFAATALVVPFMLRLDGIAGLAGWRWAFLLTGLPPVILAFVVLRAMPDKPSSAPAWLSTHERTYLETWVAAEAPPAERQASVWTAFRRPAVWFFALFYFCIVIGFWSYTFWLPQIVEARLELGTFGSGLVSAGPWLLAIVAMVVVGMVAERVRDRRPLMAGCFLVGAFGMALAAATPSAVLALVGLSLAAMGILAGTPLFWSRPATMLVGPVAGVGIALINSIGNTGGFVGPYVLGIFQDAFGGVEYGLYGLAAFLLLATVLTFVSAGRGHAPRDQDPAPATTAPGDDAVAPTPPGGPDDHR